MSDFGYGDPATYPAGTVVPGSREEAERNEWDDEIWPRLIQQARSDVLAGRLPALGVDQGTALEIYAHALRAAIDAAEDAINAHEDQVRRANRMEAEW